MGPWVPTDLRREQGKRKREEVWVCEPGGRLRSREERDAHRHRSGDPGRRWLGGGRGSGKVAEP